MENKHKEYHKNRIQAVLKDAEIEILDRLVKEKGVNRSEFVRDLVLNHINEDARIKHFKEEESKKAQIEAERKFAEKNVKTSLVPIIIEEPTAPQQPNFFETFPVKVYHYFKGMTVERFAKSVGIFLASLFIVKKLLGGSKRR